jgi:hypothetical protein
MMVVVMKKMLVDETIAGWVSQSPLSGYAAEVVIDSFILLSHHRPNRNVILYEVDSMLNNQSLYLLMVKNLSTGGALGSSMLHFLTRLIPLLSREEKSTFITDGVIAHLTLGLASILSSPPSLTGFEVHPFWNKETVAVIKDTCTCFRVLAHGNDDVFLSSLFRPYNSSEDCVISDDDDDDSFVQIATRTPVFVLLSMLCKTIPSSLYPSCRPTSPIPSPFDIPQEEGKERGGGGGGKEEEEGKGGGGGGFGVVEGKGVEKGEDAGAMLNNADVRVVQIVILRVLLV